MTSVNLAKQIIKLLVKRNQTLTTCESITGGMLGSTLTAVVGASAVYRGGFITYATDLKVSLAKVDPNWIEDQGVINERTALEMAAGTRQRCSADWAIATTGVAGPGIQDKASVGTVWVGIVGENQLAQVQQAELFKLHGTRSQIRKMTVQCALELFYACLVT